MSSQRKFNIGDRIGSYEIKSIQTGINKHRYICECDCGKIKPLDATYLKLGRKCKYCIPISFEGKRIGKVTFIKFIGYSKYECKCDCGNEFIGRIRSKSCGCHMIEDDLKAAEKLIGIKTEGYHIISFSHWEKKHNENAHNAVYNAKCKCGKLFKILRENIFRSKTCGCRIVNNHARGENQGNNKYSEKDVKIIKDMFLTGLYTRKEISKIIEIPLHAVYYIIRNKQWCHLKIDKEILQKSPVKHLMGKKNKKPEIGKTYGFWKVLEKAPSSHRQAHYLCKCKCGNIRRVKSSSILNSKSTKCYDCNAKNLANLTRKNHQGTEPLAFS